MMQRFQHSMVRTAVVLLAAAAFGEAPVAQEARARREAQRAREATFYPLDTAVLPDELVVEVGGLLPRPDGSLLVCTRRGDIWRVFAPWSDEPRWTLWTDGLQEPLGMIQDPDRPDDPDAILCSQRGEVTRIRDVDHDGRADSFEVVCDDWNISGNYHEYCFGPRRDRDGNLWVTLNRPFGQEWFGKVDWRGFAMRIGPDGKAVPVCGGLRSPAGLEISPYTGKVFYTDNQGEWCGASKLSQLVPGSFHGHPMRIDDARLPGSQVPHPGEVPNGLTFPEAKKQLPTLTMPSVWFPYNKTGRSPSGMSWDVSEGRFGPFAGQLFVGDQYGANILRVDLEEVAGHTQGALFRFREGLVSGVIRVRFDDDELIVGMSDRGWPSLGTRPFGLQRIRWSGKVPFEVRSMKLRGPRGFRLTTTKKIDPASLALESFGCSSFTYKLHAPYGSPEVDAAPCEVVGVVLGEDGRTLDLTLDGMRAGYVHELHMDGLRAEGGESLLHTRAWYTLIRFPEAE